MIKLNGKEIVINKFPDGTPLIKPDISDIRDKSAVITWNFESNDEMIILMFLVRHFQAHNIIFLHLEMPYIPNARQDRVKSNSDVFTLKYFAEFINNLGFETVTVLDPHSSVSEALIDNLVIETPKKYIDKAIANIYKETNNEPLMAFYPDEGAMKRYAGMLSMPYAFGIKKREWETGRIVGLDAAGEVADIVGKNVIIVDDISSRGGTFYHSAKKLKELGVNKIYLFVSHCEATIFDGEIFKSGLIDKVFTTDSIFVPKVQEYAEKIGVADKIEVVNYEKDKSNVTY